MDGKPLTCCVVHDHLDHAARVVAWTRWESITEPETNQLGVAAARLLVPLKPPLDRPEAKQMVCALKAAQRGRMAGVHWRRRLSAPRQELGAKRSVRADELYRILEELAARHLAPDTDAPVIGGAEVPTGPARTHRADPVGGAVRRARSSAAAEAQPEPEMELALGLERGRGRSPSRGAALGLVLPDRGHPRWAQVSADERRSLGMAARRLVRPLRDPVKQNRKLVHALNAAAAGRMTGAHWHTLLTTPREALGSRHNEGVGQPSCSAMQRIRQSSWNLALAASEGGIHAAAPAGAPVGAVLVESAAAVLAAARGAAVHELRRSRPRR